MIYKKSFFCAKDLTRMILLFHLFVENLYVILKYLLTKERIVTIGLIKLIC